MRLLLRVGQVLTFAIAVVPMTSGAHAQEVPHRRLEKHPAFEDLARPEIKNILIRNIQ